MHTVTAEGSTAMWHHHANQLRIRSVILPTIASSNEASSNSDATTEAPAPLTLRRSTRIRRPRIPWSPSIQLKGEEL